MLPEYNSNSWFSPRFAIQYLLREIRRKGPIVLSGTQYKKEREAWIMGVALFGIMKMHGSKWWLQIPTDDPPDMLAMTLVTDEEKNRNEMHSREVEIVQITHHTNYQIDEEILKKLRNMAYIKETALVVYLNRTTKIENVQAIVDSIAKNPIGVADIWIIAATAKATNDYILFSIYPTTNWVEFNLNTEIAHSEVGDSITLTRGMGTQLELLRNVPASKFVP